MNETLDSRQLNAFVVLAKTGSHTLSARQLCVTHSAISHSMRKLEQDVGCRLFVKLGKKTVLTEAGEALLLHAERVLKEMRQARASLTELNQWGCLRLRLAVEPIFFPNFLTPVLVNFRDKFPQTVIEVKTRSPGPRAGAWPDRSADLLLGAKTSANEDSEFLPLLADRFHLVVSATHPLAAKPHASRAEFAGQPCILFNGCGHERKALEDLLHQRGINLNVTGEIECLETVKNFVKQTTAMSLLPGWVIGAELRNRSFVSLPLARKAIEQCWGLIHPRAKPLNYSESMLLKFCGQQVASMT